MRIDESIFLKPFFDKLENECVVYAVMRNGLDIPQTLKGSDLDIIVEEGSLERTCAIAKEVASSNGGRLVGEIKSPRFRELAFIGYNGGGWWGCEIDFCDGGYIIEPLNGNCVLGYREKNKTGVWVLPDGCAALLGCGKELVMNGVLPQKYLNVARAAIGTGIEDCFADERFKDFVRNSVELGESPHRFEWRKLRRYLWWRSLRANPIETACHAFGFYFSKAYRLIRPVGFCIAILGTDGSGKTTLLNKVMPVLGLCFHKSVRVQHLKPDLLPSLGRLRGVKNEPGYVCTDPHGSKPSGFIGSLTRLTYLTTDYILGYWLKVRLHIAKLPVGLWIFDRYAYDILLDSRRFRIRLPRWIIKAYLFFVPKPDLIVCLGGDPEKIYARKPETSLEEVSRQVETLKRFVDQNHNAIWVDTTTTLDESAACFLKGLLS